MEPGIPQEQYGSADQYRSHLLEQYRIYADHWTGEQARHDRTNNFFLTVNTAVVTALAFAGRGDAILLQGPAVALLLLPAVAICLLWYVTLRSIAQWSVAQLETLQEMEAFLPLKPFTSEWHAKLAQKRTYIRIRTVRQVVPWLFVCVHLALFVALSKP